MPPKKHYQSVFDLLKNEPRVVMDRLYGGLSAMDVDSSNSSLTLSLSLSAYTTHSTHTTSHTTTPHTIHTTSHTSHTPYSESAMWACQAIFQSLSALSKCLLLRVLYCSPSTPLSISTLRSLVVCADRDRDRDRDRLRDSFAESVRELVSLWIFIEIERDREGDRDRDREGEGEVVLHTFFQANLQQALQRPLKPWAKYLETSVFVLQAPSSNSNNNSNSSVGVIPTVEFLEEFSHQIWNQVLGYLVKLLPATHFKGTSIEYYLRQSNLLTTIRSLESGHDENMITSKGYEYMLQDYAHQIWDYLLFLLQDVVSSSSSGPGSREEVLMLIFMLSYTEVGKAYPIKALTPLQKKIMLQFAEVGIVYMTSSASLVFYPTRTAVNMLFGSEGLQAMNNENGKDNSELINALDGTLVPLVKDYELQIIVETNMQVVAYVTTDLHLALLELFVKVHVRMPNMAFGRLVREKVKDAYRAGIEAVQIIDFLKHHAHPLARNNRSVIPDNVTDQLVLWEHELNRIKMDTILYFDLSSTISVKLFQALTTFLERKGKLKWATDAKTNRLEMAISLDAKEMVQSFLQQALT